MITNKLNTGIVAKSLRASKEALEKKKNQLESIQIDLGVDMMTGNVLRDRVSYEMAHKDLKHVIEMLITTEHEKPDHRSSKSCIELVKIIKEIKFFKETMEPLTDEDALAIARRLKYEYIPLGRPIRKALDKFQKFCFILKSEQSSVW